MCPHNPRQRHATQNNHNNNNNNNNNNNTTPKADWKQASDASRLNSSKHGKSSASVFLRRTANPKQWVLRLAGMLFLLILLLIGWRMRKGWKSLSSTNNMRGTLQMTEFSSTTVVDPDLLYDVAVIGAGPAGLTAALLAARAGWHVLLLGSSSQGLLAEATQLLNFPGYIASSSTTDNKSPPNSGLAWLQSARNQVAQVQPYAHLVPPGVQVTSLAHLKNEWHLNVFPAATYRARSVVLATGATPRRLNVTTTPAVGVHHCAVCDGPLYTGQRVVVVGGGNSAVEAVLFLSKLARHVTWVHRRDQFTADAPAVAWAQSLSNVHVLTPFRVVQWQTNSQDPGVLRGALLEHVLNGSKQELDIDGAFVLIGGVPNTSWLKGSGIALEPDGRVQVQSGTVITRSPGVWAAGEVTDARYRQAVTAAAQGAQAAMEAERFLQQQQQQQQIQQGQLPRTRVVQPLVRRVDMSAEDTSRHKKEAESHKEEDDDKACDMTQQKCLESIVQQHKVVVFSKPWCPFCHKALEAMAVAGLDHPHVIDLSAEPNTHKIQATLQQMTGRRTVPNVFVGGQSIGGGDETAHMQAQGKLVPLLQQVGALAAPSAKAETTNDSDCDNVGDAACFDQILSRHTLVVFSSHTCAECHKLLEFLSVMELSVHVVELGAHREISDAVRTQLAQHAQQYRGVPSLFLKGQSIGGYNQASKLLHSGELETKLKDAGINYSRPTWRSS